MYRDFPTETEEQGFIFARVRRTRLQERRAKSVSTGICLQLKLLVPAN